MNLQRLLRLKDGGVIQSVVVAIAKSKGGPAGISVTVAREYSEAEEARLKALVSEESEAGSYWTPSWLQSSPTRASTTPESTVKETLKRISNEEPMSAASAQPRTDDRRGRETELPTRRWLAPAPRPRPAPHPPGQGFFSAVCSYPRPASRPGSSAPCSLSSPRKCRDARSLENPFTRLLGD
jgi:hypothetical protein